ncbi:MAG TPA: hypothetical protein PKE29_15305 [Phycisphaerales bacterium]|nr:hypothetical protein [Phycisphaerales bacterium]
MSRSAKPSPRLSPARQRWLNKQVSTGRFASLDEALDFCIRQTAELDAAQAEFDKLIAEGDKGPFERVGAAWWSRFRAETAARRAARPRRKSA